MTTPAAVLYASVADLRLVLDSTDAGTGTAAQLSDEQLNLALQAASDRVTTYTGEVYDPATMPPIIGDLTLDLAAWWATTYYSKQKEMGPNHPVVLRYTEAKAVLTDIRDGKIDINVGAAGGGAAVSGASARVINSIPNIFTPDDSNTRYDPTTGYLAVSSPPDQMGRRDMLTDWWPYP
jgi:hypothetical protein